jgi:lipoprotein-releasing system permease protein
MELPLELFLALRYLRPRRSFVSVITVLSFLGVTLGVMVLIVVLSVMAGFRERLDEKIIGFNAHITVAGSDVLHGPDAVIDLIKKQPEVVAASPIIRGPVLVENEQHQISFAFIKSVPQEGDDPVFPLKQFLKMGEFELRGDSVIVGSEWAKRNAAFPGDKIDIFGPAQLSGLVDQPGKNQVVALPEEPIIRGVFQTGQFDYDLNFLLVSQEMAQHLYRMDPDTVHGIAVRIKDPADAEAVKDRLNKILPPPLLARTWMDDNRDLFNAIATERVVMTFILFFVMLVAAFGLCSTLITITVQKSREIGLMKALGANDLQVSGVFLLHGVVVGVVGAVSGTVCGLVLLHFRNPFRDFLMSAFHIEVFPSSVYGLPDIPAVINPLNVALIAISAVVICILASLIPAVNAARLAPAQALRYE